MQISDRIIVALDVPTKAGAIALLKRLPQVSFWKVGLELFISAGPEILQELQHRHKRIFLDLKLHDIPNTMAGACRSVGRYGVDLLTIHATAGKLALAASLAAVAKGAAETGCAPPQLLAVTVLTSIDARMLALELNVPLELPEQALKLAMLAQEAGVTGIVCSPQEVASLRRFLTRDAVLVCPGVRPAWSIAADQRRVMTPAEALTAGADYLVVGRPITGAADPAAAFDRVCEECAAVG